MTDDEKLVRRTLDGDEDAFRELVEKYKGMAVSLAFSMVRQPDAAQDMVQESFLRAYQSLANLREPAKFNSWFYGVVRRTCIYWLRKRGDVREISLENDEKQTVQNLPDSGEGNAPSESLESKESYHLLEKVLRSLPPKYRETILFKFVDNKTYEEIGRMIGISRSGVEARMRRAREFIRQRLVDLVGKDADLFMTPLEDEKEE